MIKAESKVFCVNSVALGDVIATAAPVKWAIENWFQDTDYKVLANPYFRDILHFVPDDKFGDVGVVHNFPNTWMLYYLNQLGASHITSRLTSMHIHLSKFAALRLLDREIPLEDSYYVPLIPTDVSRFGVDFTKAVIFVTTHRDEVRFLPQEVLLKTAEYVRSKGLIPVYVGKVADDPMWKFPFLPSCGLPDFGVDLRNKTSLRDLASIMALSRAVVGVDSGPIHLCGTTSTPIVCAYTTVAPETRIPLRPVGKTIAISAGVDCQYCQTNWSLNHHDFGTCYYEHIDCCHKLKPESFIRGLEVVL